MAPSGELGRTYGRRDRLVGEIEEVFTAHPFGRLLQTLPGIGPRPAPLACHAASSMTEPPSPALIITDGGQHPAYARSSGHRLGRRCRCTLCRRGASELGKEEIARQICDLVGLLFKGEVAAVEQMYLCAGHVAFVGCGLRGLEGRVVATPGH